MLGLKSWLSPCTRIEEALNPPPPPPLMEKGGQEFFTVENYKNYCFVPDGSARDFCLFSRDLTRFKLLQLLASVWLLRVSPILIMKGRSLLLAQWFFFFFESVKLKVNGSSCILPNCPMRYPYTNWNIWECYYTNSSTPQFCDLALNK